MHLIVDQAAPSDTADSSCASLFRDVVADSHGLAASSLGEGGV